PLAFRQIPICPNPNDPVTGWRGRFGGLSRDCFAGFWSGIARKRISDEAVCGKPLLLGDGHRPARSLRAVRRAGLGQGHRRPGLGPLDGVRCRRVLRRRAGSGGDVGSQRAGARGPCPDGQRGPSPSRVVRQPLRERRPQPLLRFREDRAGSIGPARPFSFPALPSLAFALLLAAAAAGGETFPRGETVDPVVCAADAGQSYAPYLPAPYDPARPWPLLYLSAPAARGRLAVEPFREPAERYGYILAASNVSRNGQPSGPAVQAVWKDTHERFAVDARRRYAGGFSGGGRVSILLAQGLPGALHPLIPLA